MNEYNPDTHVAVPKSELAKLEEARVKLAEGLYNIMQMSEVADRVSLGEQGVSIKYGDELRALYVSGAYAETKVKGSIAYLQYYLNTYNLSTCAGGNSQIFINDILYGLGVALDPVNNKYADGFKKFKENLKDYLEDPELGSLNFNFSASKR